MLSTRSSLFLQKCCLFHRWEKWSIKGFNITEIRAEAATLLGCKNTEKDLVNGRVSYGLLDETAGDNTRHTLCIGGDLNQGPGKWSISPQQYGTLIRTLDCFTDMIVKEAKEDKERAAASSS